MEVETPCKTPCKTSNFRWFMRRKSLGRRRRRKLPTVRLGAGDSKKKHPVLRGLVTVKLLKRIRLRWLKLQYWCVLRKLKDAYRAVLEDLVEGGTTFESMQRRIVKESYFSGVPIMVVPSAGISSFIGPNRFPSKT